MSHRYVLFTTSRVALFLHARVQVAILDRPEFDLSNFAQYIKPEDFNAISFPLAGTSRCLVDCMRAAC